MVFPTVEFLAFFSIVFPVYWFITRHRWRMGWLLLASCAFYMSWNPWLILLILFSASVDYVEGERPLSDFPEHPSEPAPLGDIARALRTEHLSARKAEFVFEKQGRK